MASLIEGYEYDIFISYRQKDNKHDGWVTEFVDNLKGELESTFKEEISVYFDINPHDGLLETHDVDASLQAKLKCLIFIPIISRTYCDPRSFAWEHEFKAFVEQASMDQFGLKVKLPNGNTASRVLPIRIHDLENEDIKLCELLLGGVLRGIEFIYKEPGVNKPLTNDDDEKKNLNNTKYRLQINKTANAIKEVISGLKTGQAELSGVQNQVQGLSEQTSASQGRIKETYPLKSSNRFMPFGLAIISLIIILTMLFYPRLFKNKDNLASMTVPVTVLNEFGGKETRRVFKEEYITKLAIFPFNNENNDSVYNWLQYGIYDAILEDLYQFNYISIRGNKENSLLKAQINFAATSYCSQFLTGAFRVTEGVYTITSRIYQTSNGALLKEKSFRGSDFFSLIDSVSLNARADLRINRDILNSSPDLPAKEQITNNLTAFRFYIEGLYIGHYNKNLGMAIKLDSTFALALLVRARDCYNYQFSEESAVRSIDQAMRHRQRLSEYNEISTRIFSLFIHGEKDKAIALAEFQNELKPADYRSLSTLIETYERILMYDKAVKAYEQLNKLVPTNPDYKLRLAIDYYHSNKLDNSLEILQKMIREDPGNVNALAFMGEIYLLKNNPEVAKEIFTKAMLLKPEEKGILSKLVDHISYIQKNHPNNEFLEQFTGKYRFEDEEMNLLIFIKNNQLAGRAENQEPVSLYPVSDNQFVSPMVINYIDRLDLGIMNFVRDKKDKIIKFTYWQKGINGHVESWKEDSLITESEDLFNHGNKTESLNSFRKAYEQNPEHYYLANFIRHLEFIQSQEYERLKPVFLNYTGKYGDISLFRENDQFYYENKDGLIYKLYPLSEQQFMVPSHYNILVQIVKAEKKISGLKFIYRYGREEFSPRSK